MQILCVHRYILEPKETKFHCYLGLWFYLYIYQLEKWIHRQQNLWQRQNESFHALKILQSQGSPILLISYEHKENWMCKISTGVKDAETSISPFPFFSFKNVSITYFVIPYLRCIVTPLEYSDTLWDLFVFCQCRVQIMSLLKPLHHSF